MKQCQKCSTIILTIIHSKFIDTFIASGGMIGMESDVLEKTSVTIEKRQKEFLREHDINTSSILRKFLKYYIENFREVNWKK